MQRWLGILIVGLIAELPTPRTVDSQDVGRGGFPSRPNSEARYAQAREQPEDDAEDRSNPRGATSSEESGPARRFRLTRPSSGFLLTREYPRRALRIELVVDYDRPGTVLDTVGIDAAPVGSFALLITDDEHFQFQVYDPGQRSDIREASGWHVLRSRSRFAPDERHTLDLLLTDEEMALRVDGREQASAVFAATLSGRPLYVGDIPDDDHWGGRYNIHPAMTGEVTVNRIGRAPVPDEEADAAIDDDSRHTGRPDRGRPQAGVSLEPGIDRPGSDYRRFALAEPSPELCRDECAGDTRCRAYTYVRPGIQGETAICWLKAVIPDPIPGEGCVSGVKRRRGED
jgi:hypothetical protein